MQATTVEIDSGHLSLITHPDQIAPLIWTLLVPPAGKWRQQSSGDLVGSALSEPYCLDRGGRRDPTVLGEVPRPEPC